MGLICPLGTFCPLGHFGSGRFGPWDVLSLVTFCPLGRSVPGTFCLWTFCLGMFCLGSFICASQFALRQSKMPIICVGHIFPTAVGMRVYRINSPGSLFTKVLFISICCISYSQQQHKMMFLRKS